MTAPRRVFVDTEWTAAPWDEDSQLLWLGLADERGAVWSAVDADIDLAPLAGGSIAPLIQPDEPRLTRTEMGVAIVDFCGDVDEFWAWVPTEESVAAWFGLGDEAPDVFARYWDIDLQHLRALVDPWPAGWPDELHDLRPAAEGLGVEIPERPPDYLNPGVHVQWNRELFRRIVEASSGPVPGG